MYIYKQHNLSEPNLTYSVLAFNFVKCKYNLHDPAALSNNLRLSANFWPLFGAGMAQW